MTAAAIDRVPQGGADQSYRIALRVRLNQPKVAVHKLDAHRFDPEHGHIYKATCGVVLMAANGAMRTTYEASCQTCLGPSHQDDVPRCNLGPPSAPSTCYCTMRPGCPYLDDDEEADRG